MGFLAPLVGIGAGVAGAGVTGVTTLGAVGIGLGAAGLTLAGVSRYQQGQQNKAVFGQQAEQIDIARQFDAQRQEEQFEGLLGRNRAIVGASGITMAGSPIVAEIANQYQFEKDQRIRDYNAQVQAGRAKSQGQIASRTGTAAFGSSLLGAGAFAAGKISLLSDKKAGDSG